jgi:galactose mutarotase-like enzyme
MNSLEISNDHLIAKVSTTGAELISLLSKKSRLEALWQADPAHWARHAPVLFPIVGKLQDNEYFYNDKSYSLGQHGFARDAEFKVADHSKESISLELTDNDLTRQMYPFGFKLVISYILKGNTLTTKYEVSNPAAELLFFSIGGHPAYNCPPQGFGDRSDFAFKFNRQENTNIQYLTDGVFAGKQKSFAGQNIHITNDLFDDDALVFENLNSDHISLIDTNEAPILTFSFVGFPYLGLWSKRRNSPFVCIEPWFGLADTHDHNKNINDKKGIIKLEENGHFECEYGVTIHY